MFLIIESSVISLFLRGYSCKGDSHGLCMLDTEDLVIEEYTNSQYLDMLGTLKNQLLWIKTDSNGTYPLGAVFLHGSIEVDFHDRQTLYFKGNPLVTLSEAPKRLDLSYLCVNVNGVCAVRKPYKNVSQFKMYLFYGQKIGSLYRVIIALDDDYKYGITDRLFVCLLFTVDRFLGVEYAFTESGRHKVVTEQCLPDKSVRSRISLLLGRQ